MELFIRIKLREYKTAQTAHNRIVYAPPPEAAPGLTRLGHCVPMPRSATLGRAAIASQCPYMPAPTS
jgi:hypothetical protein